MTDDDRAVARLSHQVVGDDHKDLGDALLLWCPGCELLHAPCVRLGVIQRPLWQWDGNLELPTLSPSIRVSGVVLCHSFVRDGQWQFLGDCEHTLAGQTVPLPPLPAWAADG